MDACATVAARRRAEVNRTGMARESLNEREGDRKCARGGGIKGEARRGLASYTMREEFYDVSLSRQQF